MILTQLCQLLKNRISKPFPSLLNTKSFLSYRFATANLMSNIATSNKQRPFNFVSKTVKSSFLFIKFSFLRTIWAVLQARQSNHRRTDTESNARFRFCLTNQACSINDVAEIFLLKSSSSEAKKYVTMLPLYSQRQQTLRSIVVDFQDVPPMPYGSCNNLLEINAGCKTRNP